MAEMNQGVRDYEKNVVKKVLGRKPVSLEEWVNENRMHWLGADQLMRGGGGVSQSQR